jgi:hypothetical protein
MGMSITGNVSISGNLTVSATTVPTAPQNIVVISTVTSGATVPNSTYYGTFNGISNGIGPYLSVTGISALGACNFTAEAWVYINNTGTYTIYSTGATGGIAMGITGCGRPYGAVGISHGGAGEGSSLSLTAGSGYVFTSVLYGAYGVIGGAGPDFTRGPQTTGYNKQTIAESYVIGKGSASVPANNCVGGSGAWDRWQECGSCSHLWFNGHNQFT